MNDLTRKLVILTAHDNRQAARMHAVSDHFFIKLKVAYTDYILLEFGVPLKYRAIEIWSWMHPEDVDNDGFVLSSADWNGLDVDTALGLVTEAVIERKLARNPGLQLTDYGDLPRIVVDPSPKEVQDLYRDEYAWAIWYHCEHPNSDIKKLAVIIQKQYPNYWLPAENIATSVLSAVEEDNMVGLPLFRQQ